MDDFSTGPFSLVEGAKVTGMGEKAYKAMIAEHPFPETPEVIGVEVIMSGTAKAGYEPRVLEWVERWRVGHGIPEEEFYG